MAVHSKTSAGTPEDLVYSDDLTGLRNRRFLYRIFSEDWAGITGTGEGLSLAVVDLDFFKQVNDTHGHLTGDLVLSETASLIESFLDSADHAVRYGGDEFVLLLSGRSKQDTGLLLESLRRGMADKEFVSKEENQPLEVVLSFSIGVATFPHDGASGEELMAAADKALYASKRAGRNRVTLSGELPPELEDEIDRYRTFPSKSVVGRQDLIETLVGVCELIGMGTGTWTALSGPAGIGKSRILHEGLRLGPEAGVASILIDLSEDMAGQPHAGIARILGEVRARQPDSFDRIIQVADDVRHWFLQAHIPEAVESLAAEEMPAPSPNALRKTLLECFSTLASDQKWLFLIDDVTYLDPHSSELLRVLIEEERLPIAVVSAHRSGSSDAESESASAFLESLDRFPWFEQRPLSPLSQESVERLIAVLLPNHHAPREFTDRLYELTEGNPLFVEEVLRIGIASGRITRRGGEWFVQPLDRHDLPANLEAAIARRMALLDDETGTSIARASAIGTSFTSELLQALLGKNEGEILDFVDKARDMGFVEGGLQGDSDEIRFTSSVIRDQAYEQMDPGERTRTHREIGKIEEHRAGGLVGALASRLAYHFERGEVYEKARAYLAAAEASAPPIIVAGEWSDSEVPVHRRRRITEAAVPLPDEAWPSLDEALRALAQATKSLWMYPVGSPIVEAAFGELHHRLVETFRHAGVISLAAVEGTLVVNGVPYPARRQQFLVRGLLGQLAAQELRGLTIRDGIAEHEVAFLVEQLASDEPVERDPEIWEAILDRNQIENVDFGDRVYVPAEGVARAPVMPGTVGRAPSGVIRVASTAEMDQLARQAPEGGPSEVADSSPELSPESLRELLDGFEARAAIDAEIETLVPAVAALLKRLLQNADHRTLGEHKELAEVVGVDGRRMAESEGREPAPGTAASSQLDIGTPPVEGESSGDYLSLLRSERNPQGKRNLLTPAEEKFRAFVEARDLASARTVLRFIRQCRAFDGEAGELALEGERALVSITSGDTVQLLLCDLLANAERPDPEALSLLLEIGQDAGGALVTFLRETDDLRCRRAVAGMLKEIGGEPLDMALESITHGDNPMVARRVIGVLDRLSPDLARDLTSAVQVRNPGVLGEAVKVVQRQPRIMQLQVIGSLLESASPEMVGRGIYYLVEWNLTEAQDSLLSLLRHSEDPEILAAVTAAIARWRLPGAVPILGEMLGRKQVMRLVPFFSRGLRREFARALAAIDTPEAATRLADFTMDVDSEVRNIARGLRAPTGA